MNFDIINQTLTDQHLPTYHLDSLLHHLNKNISSFSQVTTWPKQLRLAFANTPINSYISSQLTISHTNSAKALLTFTDQVSIETVLIPTKPNHYSICVSSQSGCAMGCRFCATGSLGLIRSLTAEEITDQLLYWRQTYPHIHPKSIVFMGMGEPFANQINVFTAIRWFHDYYRIGYRHLTLSTCGLPQGILSLAATYPQVNLAVSLHAARQSLREQLMPVAQNIPLSLLSQAIHQYLKITNRQITFEYLLIQNLNDTLPELDQLIKFLNQFPRHLTHVNLIGYNYTTKAFVKPSKNRIRFVRDYLHQHHFSATIRKSLGEDIIGACGQLALKSH